MGRFFTTIFWQIAEKVPLAIQMNKSKGKAGSLKNALGRATKGILILKLIKGY